MEHYQHLLERVKDYTSLHTCRDAVTGLLKIDFVKCLIKQKVHIENIDNFYS